MYYLNKDLESVKKSKATLKGVGRYENGAFRLDAYSLPSNELVLTLHCLDSSLADWEGEYVSYHKNGGVFQQGNYRNGQKEGVWQKWREDGKPTDSIVYAADKPRINAEYYYRPNGARMQYQCTDSATGTIRSILYDTGGRIKSELAFHRCPTFFVVKRAYTDKGVAVDTVPYDSTSRIKASFKDGKEAWKKLLEKIANPKLPIEKGAPVGSNTVSVLFDVKIDGSIDNIRTLTHHGFGMEEQIVEFIQKTSQNWLPALCYGHPINYTFKQSITFNVL